MSMGYNCLNIWVNLSDKEQDLLKDFRNLTPEGQDIVTSTATGLVNNPKYNLKAQAANAPQPETEEAPPEATSQILKDTGTGGGPV